MKRQGQIVAATINNFSAVEEALKNMENSAGSAEAEMEIIRESAEYAMNRLKETFTSLAQHSVSRGGLKDLINAGTTILEIVDGIVSQIGLIPTILTTIFGIMSAKKMTSGGIFGKNANGKLTILGSQVSGGFKSWWNGLSKTTPELQVQKAEIQSATSAIEQYHKAYKNGMITQQTYNNVMQNSNRIVRDYGNAIRAGASEADAYTAANKRLNTELQNVGKNGKAAGVGAKAAAIGIKVLNTAASMLLSMGISAAINAIFKAISDGINSIENHISKLKELTDTEKGLKSEIKSLNDELSTTKLRIAELEKMPKLTLMEQEELNKLKETNDELERQIRLKNGELTKAASERNKEAKKLWEELNSSSANRWDWWNFIPGAGHVVDAIIDLNNTSKGNNWKLQTSDLETYKKKLEELNKIKETNEYKKGSDELKKQVEDRQKELDDLHDKIQGYYNDTWNSLKNGLDPNIISNQEIIKKIDEVINEWDKINDKTDKTLTDLYNNSKFATVKQYLDNLALKGELTAEKFKSLTDKDVKGIEEFKKALEDIPNANAENVVESIIEALKKLGKEVNSSTKEIKIFKNELEKLYEILNQIVSKQEKLAEAFKKTALGGALSAKEVLELIEEMPELTKYLKEIEGGYTISEEGFIALSEQNLDKQRTKLNNQIEETKKQIRFLQEYRQAGYDLENSFGQDTDALRRYQWYADLTEEIRKKLNINSWGEITGAINELQESLNGFEFSYNLITEAFNSQKLEIEGVNAAYEEAKSKINDYNKDIQAVDSAIKNLNENILLNYDEMNEIVELSPDLEDYFQKEENGYSISIDKLEELRKQSYETRNNYIKDVRARVEADIDAANSTRANIEKEKEDLIQLGINGAAAAIQFAELNKSLGDVDERLKLYTDILEKLDGLERDITYNNDNKDKKSLAEEMQEQIDYYKMLISAVETVKDKYTEAIDSEIDALNDSKDALKETNDERQRELDLIEARNNLENAKKRKVWVYSEANGFQQVQDEKAVKEAEEKYRDAIQEVQEAAIDKQIDALEKKKETLENQVKDLTELENNIEDSKTIAQALSALGLSEEKDLLNLSDSVKQGIKEGLAEAILIKDQEDNKDNDKYVPVNLDDVLSHLGATVTAEDIKSLNLITKDDFNNAVQDFATSMKEYQDANVSNVINNSGGMVISPTFNINGVTDPNEVAKVVNSEMTNLFTKINNSIK